jgi:Fibronectin type III domain
MTIFMGYSGSAFAGDATLSWDPPTANMDNSPLTDLAGFKVYYGRHSGLYGKTTDVGDQTSYTVTDLGPGTYYFAISAYDSSGNEGGLSTEVSKRFSGPVRSTDSQSTGISGGCGTVFQKNGKPPGQGEAGDMLALVGASLIVLLRNTIQKLKFIRKTKILNR